MDVQEILHELEALASERTKKIYMSQGAQEPLFGVATGAMKPILKKVKLNQALADELYATGIFDAMYFAGMIAEPKVMTEEDYDRWMETAYFHMISDYIVAVTLAESDIAQRVSDKWIATGKELYMSAGYSCYCWLLGNRKDTEFDKDKLSNMLDTVEKTIHNNPNRTRYAMNNFVTTVGVSYVPLHEQAVKVANTIGTVEVFRGDHKASVGVAAEEIQKMADKGKLGFKRKYVRC